MELAVNALNVDMSKETISQIKEKTRKVFSRIGEHIVAIRLTIDDINGPKGGKDKKCIVVVHCHGLPSVVASNHQVSILSAVNLALTKAHASLVKKIKRHQSNRPFFKKVEEDEVIEQIREEFINNQFK